MTITTLAGYKGRHPFEGSRPFWYDGHGNVLAGWKFLYVPS